jgi:hypothetical protein
MTSHHEWKVATYPL